MHGGVKSVIVMVVSQDTIKVLTIYGSPICNAASVSEIMEWSGLTCSPWESSQEVVEQASLQIGLVFLIIRRNFIQYTMRKLEGTSLQGKLILVTGGARSGKSSFAEGLAKEAAGEVAYLATAIAFDEGMKDRIQKHRESRPSSWTTYEGYKDLHKLVPQIAKQHQIILLDCITIMVTNLMFGYGEIDWDQITHGEIDKIENGIKDEIMAWIHEVRAHNLHCIMVTNEVGMGIVPENRLSRIFRDIAGRMNQLIAKLSDEVYFTVSGIPTKIK